MADQRYRAVLGMSLNKAQDPGFCDIGIVYHGLDALQMAELEVMGKDFIAQNGDELARVFKPLADALTAKGIEVAKARMGVVTPTTEKGR